MALPLPDHAAESALFSQYHFCQYQMDRWRASLDLQQPAAQQMHRIESMWYLILRLKRLLVISYFGHVLAVAAQHLARNILPMQPEYLPFLSHGLEVLHQVIGRFDPARHRGFANYLKWHLMRRFARMDPDAMPHAAHSAPSSPNINDPLTTLRTLVDQIERRPDYQNVWNSLLPEQRQILEQQFGPWSGSWDQSLRLGAGRLIDPVTLSQKTGEPLRRVIARRRRAMRQLRQRMRAVDRHIDAPRWSLLCVSSLQREQPI